LRQHRQAPGVTREEERLHHRAAVSNREPVVAVAEGLHPADLALDQDRRQRLQPAPDLERELADRQRRPRLVALALDHRQAPTGIASGTGTVIGSESWPAPSHLKIDWWPLNHTLVPSTTIGSVGSDWPLTLS